ncbi:hypothetical protein JHK85_022287 [Glycine max]|nr:hypothetical protein JHK85_022287 [Glycine max]
MRCHCSWLLYTQFHIVVDNLDVNSTNSVNSRAAVSAALLLLPSEFTEDFSDGSAEYIELYATLLEYFNVTCYGAVADGRTESSSLVLYAYMVMMLHHTWPRQQRNNSETLGVDISGKKKEGGGGDEKMVIMIELCLALLLKCGSCTLEPEQIPDDKISSSSKQSVRQLWMLKVKNPGQKLLAAGS